MNSDFVLVRGDSTLWFWHGLRGWCTAVDGAIVYPTREGAEKSIARQVKRGKWAGGNVGYVTVEEAREMLAERRAGR